MVCEPQRAGPDVPSCPFECGHGAWRRRVEIQVTCLSNPEQEAVRVLIFSVPTYLDVRGCPPLALSFDSAPEKDKHGLLGLSKLKDLKLPGQPRVAPETRSGAICGEEPPMGPWLLPSLEPHSTLRIALRDADPQGLLSWVALREVRLCWRVKEPQPLLFGRGVCSHAGSLREWVSF